MNFPSSPLFPVDSAVNASGHLVLGGCDVVDLVTEFGTPMYVFDEATIRGQCRDFKEAFAQSESDNRVVYAAKAFINKGLAQILVEEGLGMDVVSGGELAIARAVGFPPEHIYFHGNNKSPDELREAMDYGVGRVVVDNFTELDILDRIAKTQGKRQRILLRISPGVDPHTHAHTTTGTLDSKFGFPLDTGQADQAMVQAIGSENLDLIGLHFHLGSPVFEMDPYVQAVEAVVNLAKSYANRGFDFKEFSPGGGFAIAYTLDDEPPTPSAYAKTIIEVVQRTCGEAGLDMPRLVVEPGRALIGRAGVALYTIGATKDIPDLRRYIAVDGGMGDNIRPALYDARYEAVVANKMQAQATQLVTIAGKYCESGDILVRDVMLPPTEFGDLIAIPAAGAYCLSMASTYNMNPRPPVVLVNSGLSRLLRRRETYEDMMALDR